MVIDSGLREKIADVIDFCGIIEDADLKRSEIVVLASEILAIPEIKEALEQAYGRRELAKYYGAMSARHPLT